MTTFYGGHVIRAASLGSINQQPFKPGRENDHAWHKAAQPNKEDTCPLKCAGPRPYELEPGLWVCAGCLNLELASSPRIAAMMSNSPTT